MKHRTQTTCPDCELLWKALGHRTEADLYRVDPLLSLLAQLCCDSRSVPLVLPELHKILLKRDEAKRINFRMVYLISEIEDLFFVPGDTSARRNTSRPGYFLPGGSDYS
jgi:hypothetical protein